MSLVKLSGLAIEAFTISFHAKRVYRFRSVE